MWDLHDSLTCTSPESRGDSVQSIFLYRFCTMDYNWSICGSGGHIKPLFFAVLLQLNQHFGWPKWIDHCVRIINIGTTKSDLTRNFHSRSLSFLQLHLLQCAPLHNLILIFLTDASHHLLEATCFSAVVASVQCSSSRPLWEATTVCITMLLLPLPTHNHRC